MYYLRAIFVSFKASAQRRTWPQMPVKTTAEAIFGAIVVFPLVGLCWAEALMVTFWGEQEHWTGGFLPSNGCLLSTSGTNTIPGGYMTSYYKKDGSSSHRRHQGPSMESIASSEGAFHIFSYIESPNSFLLIAALTSTSDYATWQPGRSQTKSFANKSSSGLLPRPPVQTIHGRTDWSAKYGHR